MAVIHNTTMTPGKLELLASWLPEQPWYTGADREPRLSKAGGFRLDDPQGEVGIEFMAVTDTSGDRPVSYHVPLSYRGAPLAGAEQGLIGTSEHGVLGRRWVYDGVHDPVLIAQLLALLQGRAEPQAQNETGTRDPSVTVCFAGPGFTVDTRPTTVDDGPHGTRLLVDAESGPGPGSARRPMVEVARILRPDGQSPGPDAPRFRGHVTAGWRLPDGGVRRGRFVVLHDAAT